MGSMHWAYARTVIGTPGDKWRKPSSHERALHTESNEPSYGIGLISKIPVRSWRRMELGRSLIGLPLPVASDKGMKWRYIKDEPRVALIAELENGYTVAATHLSFVPFINYFQLRILQRAMKNLPGKKLIIGDLNLGWNIPGRFTRWKSLVTRNTYPTRKPVIQFDYILAEHELTGFPLTHPTFGISDHSSIGIELY
jgi:endonuclease/exonuclease/phosphatase family metal-dependent hydrolase